MNAHTANSELSFELPNLSYIDARWEEPNLREAPVSRSARRAGLGEWFARRINAFRAWQQEQATKAQLQSLDNRELMDIGLTRADLHRVFDDEHNADLRERGLRV